jgi:predicted amidohydrolase YtcJ
MRPTRVMAVVAALGATSAHAQGTPARPATMILVGGRVFTADPGRPWAEAIAIRDSVVALVGTRAEVERLAGPATRRLDLGGRVVIPGINDAHAHVLSAPPDVEVVTPGAEPPDPSFALVLDSLRTAAARAPAGSVLRVNVGPSVLGDSAARMRALDAAVPGHPVWLTAWSGHGAIVNGAAMRALGIGEAVRDPAGGWYERDRAGRLTGLLHEYAWWNHRQRLTEALADSALAAMYAAHLAEAARFGITSVQDFAGVGSREQLTRVIGLARPALRVRVMRRPGTDERGRRMADWPVGPRAPSPHVTVSGVKYILDGTPVEAMAAERADYADRPGHRGRLNFPADTVRAMLAEALRVREQPLLHVVGDSAVAVALSSLRATGAPAAWRALRPRLEHADGLMPDLRATARALGVVVVQNPTHFTIVSLADRRFAGVRRQAYQPLRSLLEQGIPIALGSDGPMNPFLNVMLATIHPINPSEALTREQAIVAYTRGSAYAEHAERRKGTLAAGMLADLAVLSQDVFAVPTQALPATVSVLTVVGGRVVHDVGAVAALPGARRPD